MQHGAFRLQDMAQSRRTHFASLYVDSEGAIVPPPQSSVVVPGDSVESLRLTAGVWHVVSAPPSMTTRVNLAHSYSCEPCTLMCAPLVS